MQSIKEIIRFLEKIDDSGDCWQWLGAKQSKTGGYGVWRRHKEKTYLAHRTSYELFVGEIPKDMELDHLCKNKYCVNPSHLEIVTHEENQRRRIMHNPRGSHKKTQQWHRSLSSELLKTIGMNKNTK